MTTILVVIFIFICSMVIWALYGKGENAVKDKEEKSEDTTLRRRAADKIIEEQFPDSEGHQYRRKEDIEAFEETGKVEDDFKLPYLANEIIPEGSKYWVYNRTLMNSEIYAMKGDFPTAISLYRGVYERVIDQGINAKIKADVDYLQEYQKLHLQRKTEALRQKAIEKKGSEIRLSLDGPLTIPEKIQIALTPSAMDMASRFDINKIVDDIAEKVAVKNLTDSKRRQEEIENYRTQIAGITEKIDILMKSKEHADSLQVESIDSEIRELKEKTGEISKLKDGLLSIHDNLLDIRQEGAGTGKGIEGTGSQLFSPAGAAGKQPAPAEARFQSIPGSAKGKAPVQDVPGPREVEFQKEIQREVKEKEDDTEEIEVLSQFEKEEEFAGLSDEDIFEKILKDDLSKKKDDSFEIVGYNREDTNPSYDIIDKEQEEKQKEEEQFYRKFLRHGKRVRKELPILKVSYDFSKLPDEFSLSKDQNILQYSFYKYKPMLEKANELIKIRNVRDAINYYNVVKGQNIPSEFKVMLGKNISELTEYIEKYLSAD